MLDYRPIALALGALIFMLGASMAIPTLIDLVAGHDDWQTFSVAMGITIIVGGMLFLANRGMENNLTLREAFMLTVLSWLILPAFAAIPLVFSELELSVADAYFEAMSGLTTTGATVITGLDTAPPGILMWRAILQWLGGIGIIVMAVAILPMLQIGGMQLFRMESSDTSDKILPRAAQISWAISGLYVGLSAICVILLILAGMTPFDAVAHAMTSVATGGFSTSDGSLGNFDSAAIDFIVFSFCVIGSMPFVVLIQMARGRPLAFWRDEQAKTFLLVVTALVTAVSLWLMVWKDFTLGEAVRYGGFNIISVMTGAGFATTDYSAWGSFSVTLFFLVMFIGGCAGSASCGIKIFRFQVLFRSMGAWMNRIWQPNGIFIARYNGQPIDDDVKSSVMSFLVLFMATFVVLSIAVATTGLDWVTAFSGVGATLANVGPGLGDIIGPAGTYGPLPDSAKWILSLAMLLGRLELFTVFVLLSRTYWKA
ncbi:Trk system potassium uptake protein [Kordiimonas sediminis]|uniref:Trk system potassium uptake protein n=1 Tax=Kordiimonas sediminis TaxID=1735581 RepID=A0A919ANK6_9PROT|nr:TrkH family potassium uptake protein [Kordiimonas sediminis]GHF15702.1 Trk system potassium uptake protein [Kordiimonas sediminis]